MTDSNIFTHLKAQAEARGADLGTLRALVDDASDSGATATLLGVPGMRPTRTTVKPTGRCSGSRSYRWRGRVAEQATPCDATD